MRKSSSKTCKAEANAQPQLPPEGRPAVYVDGSLRWLDNPGETISGHFNFQQIGEKYMLYSMPGGSGDAKEKTTPKPEDKAK